MSIKPQFVYALLLYIASKNGVSMFVILSLIIAWLWIEKGKSLLIIVCFTCLSFMTSSIENQPIPMDQFMCVPVVKVYSEGMEIKVNSQRFRSFDITPSNGSKICAMMHFKEQPQYQRRFIDPLSRYQQSNNIRGTVSLTNIDLIEPSFIEQVKQSITELIFPQKEDDQFWMIHHSGLWLTSFISILTSLLHLKLKQNQVHIIIHMILVFFSFLMWDVRTVRLLIQSSFRLLKLPTNLARYIALVGVSIIFPFSVTSLAFLFPWLFFMLQFNNWNAVKRWLVLYSFQQWIFASFSPFFVILYGIIGQIIWIFHLIHRIIDISFLISLLNQALQFLEHSSKFVGGLSVGSFFSILFLLSLNPYLKSHKRLTIVFVLTLLLQPIQWIPQVHFINIGQGHATLIKHFNKSILIDTGKSSHYAYLKHTLNSFRIRALNALLITHDDDDHSGSIEHLINDKFIDAPLKQKTSWESKDLIIQSLLEDRYEDSNEDSGIYRIQINDLTLLLTGDAYHSQEKKIIDLYHHLNVDVLLVGHHGSRTSTHPDFIAHIKPVLSIISAQNSMYGHPHVETLRTLQKHQSTILELEKHGDVSIYILPWFKVVLSSEGGFAIMR